jgi:ABC-type transport system involved in multi-copper enzyme maturation permease subunit
MRQFAAILLDSYRELRARKLFWLALVISGLVVAAFGAVGFNPKGLKIIVWQVDSPWYNSNVIPPAVFYKQLFMGLGVAFWLAWGASILALVSTAGMIPDLISSGSIDLVLSKPLGRFRLFLMKFAGALLFVLLQVGIFTFAAFLVIGLRGGVWLPGIFLAVPIVLCFFTYLYSICAVLGLVTRSTIASLVLTLIIWFLIFGLHLGESIMLAGRLGSELEIKGIEKELAALRERQADRQDLARLEDELADEQSSHRVWKTFHNVAYALKTVLPKTTETVELMNRVLLKASDMPEPPEERQDRSPFGGRRVRGRELEKAIMEAIHERPTWWVLGTSLGFVAAMIGIAGWIFCRRDF